MKASRGSVALSRVDQRVEIGARRSMMVDAEQAMHRHVRSGESRPARGIRADGWQSSVRIDAMPQSPFASLSRP
jgi:hypothetical protein